MSDWQKVRVAFNDADGNGVSAVMWRVKNALQVWRSTDPSDEFGFAVDFEGVMVSPIRELPTGVGAVIRVTDCNDGMTTVGEDGDVYVRGSGEFWTDGEGDFIHSDDMTDWQYEILSEGIQIGDVK
ncbi:hypothetical protein Pan2_92 [Pseudanabaena phage Pan2]|nr:hypothetical protein Pan2_92 [Pseudanabaena phage Pan2]